MDDDEALSPRKVPKQSRAKATVDAIVTAAAQVLAGEGFVKTNTNRIARVAGVSIGSLYQYFPNKDALLAALDSGRLSHATLDTFRIEPLPAAAGAVGLPALALAIAAVLL